MILRCMTTPSLMSFSLVWEPAEVMRPHPLADLVATYLSIAFTEALSRHRLAGGCPEASCQ